MFAKFTLVRACAFGALALPFGACDFSERESLELEIISPDNEATFRPTSDVRAREEGTQISVRVAGEGEGHVIELLRLRGGAPQVMATSSIQSDLAVFDSVTIYPGANRLQARDTETGLSSLPLTVYLDDSCGQIRFIEPQVPENAPELVLGPDDDRDSVPCGDGFNLRVVIATGLPDGSEVALVVENQTIAQGTTHGGALVIDKVPLDRFAHDGDGSFMLQLRLEDLSCPLVPFSVPMRIDCQGPMLCEIEEFNPAHQTLTGAADKEDKLPGVQLDIDVRTSADAYDQPVLLVINDDSTLVGKTSLELDGGVATDEDVDAGAPTVHFPRVSLPEGDLRLRAECRDAAGNLTVSERHSDKVDSLGCSIAIASPLPNTVFMPDMNANFATVPVSATFSGGDCKTAFSVVAADETCSGLFTGMGEKISVGQSVLSPTLKLTQGGPNVLCVGIEDLNGNKAQVTQRVIFDDGTLPTGAPLIQRKKVVAGKKP
jgi:hypothetical protein